jgi:hypothetical protein
MRLRRSRPRLPVLVHEDAVAVPVEPGGFDITKLAVASSYKNLCADDGRTDERPDRDDSHDGHARHAVALRSVTARGAF